LIQTGKTVIDDRTDSCTETRSILGIRHSRRLLHLDDTVKNTSFNLRLALAQTPNYMDNLAIAM